MKEVIKKIYWEVSLLLQTLISVLSVLIFSSFKNKKYYKKHKSKNSTCRVLGNGPSLRFEFERNIEDFKSSEIDIFCVNFFCSNPLFYEIKPSNYVIADNIFWMGSINPETMKMLDEFYNSMNSINWSMNLFVPNDSYKIIKRKISNCNINLIPYNRTPVDGYKYIRHFIYKMNLGMPKAVNILNATTFLAVNLGYENIILYGADHSWISDLYVDDDNIICSYQNHFYGKKTSFKMPRGSLALGLRSIADALDSYVLIKNYSEFRNSRIINKTSKSFLDIFDRED